MNQLHSHFSLPVSTVYKKTEPALSGCISNPIYLLSLCARMDVSGRNHIQVWPFSGIMNSVLACVMTQLCAWVKDHYSKSSHRVQFKRTNVWTQQTGKGSVAAAAKHCSFISRSCEEWGGGWKKKSWSWSWGCFILWSAGIFLLQAAVSLLYKTIWFSASKGLM